MGRPVAAAGCAARAVRANRICPASTPAALGNLGGTAAPRLPPHYVNAEEK